MRRYSLPALAALMALTAAACSTSPDTPDTDAAPSSPPERPTATGSATQPPPPEHTRKTEPPAPSAADGQNTDACTDGNCEITVTKPVTIRFQGPDGTAATLSVTEVGPDKIEYEVKSGNGQSKGGASGPGQGCITVLRSNGSGNSCGGLADTRPSAQPDAVVIQATTGANGTARLHIVSP
ncbi:hypothetical protein [Streptomyces sp. AC512_CC834]|uniref:hypothetical protein n=1 Tax=Streptomyces sp. AC512_CC834 TaxID=2823691 RepID=UPI001C2644AE|nr:hypothetical protein [Streptomyces sp. AC512_CC834]